jgi:hypothetical protein
MIHFPGIFVVGMATDSPICALGRCCPPSDRNVCINHNHGKNCQDARINFSCKKINDDPCLRCCYQEGYIQLSMCFGENLFFQMKKYLKGP